jgi:threonine/homoserine/homoserine lactone efflux protein
MLEVMLRAPSFAAFLVASLVLALTPGPGVVYLLTQTLSRGRPSGLASVAGIALGNLANAVLASLGLAVLMATSAMAFTLVKFAGAAYLVYLAIQTLRATPDRLEAVKQPPNLSLVRVFRDGFLVALLNPKTALFFAALLPQFIVPQAPPLAQTLLLGAVFVAMAMCTDTLYVCTAAALAGRIRGSARWRGVSRYVSAATFLGLAAYAALAHPRSVK